jgi:hypothetical protein
MPLPSKRIDEDKDQFISRCIITLINKGEAKDRKQAAAICYQQLKK